MTIHVDKGITIMITMVNNIWETMVNNGLATLIVMVKHGIDMKTYE